MPGIGLGMCCCDNIDGCRTAASGIAAVGWGGGVGSGGGDS